MRPFIPSVGKIAATFGSLWLQLNWCHLFLTSSVQTAIDWLRRFHKDSEQQGTHTTDQYLDWNVVVRVLVCWICAVSFYLRHLQVSWPSPVDCSWLWPVFQKDWEDSWMGPVSIQNILWSHLFDKMLGSLPSQRLGLYLMENQGWERIFLHFWRKHGHGTIIGVPHSTIRHWDLRYFDTTTHKSLAELPPRLSGCERRACLANATKFLLPNGSLCSVEALRCTRRTPSDWSEWSFTESNKTDLNLGDIRVDTTPNVIWVEKPMFSLLKSRDLDQTTPKPCEFRKISTFASES